MDMQFGADGSFYLLTYGDGFFNINADAGMYRWDYVKGQRAPKAVAHDRQDRRPRAADGPVHRLGLERRRSGRLDPLRVELRRRHRRSPPRPTRRTSTRSAGRYTAVLTVIDSSGPVDLDEHGHHGGQHHPDGDGRPAPIDGGLFSFGDKIQYKVTVTDPEDGVDQLQRRHR